MVRLAIASEFHKKGLRREDMFEKGKICVGLNIVLIITVCSTIRKGPVFNRVFAKANEFLESNFGYRLVPLPVVAGSANVAAKTNKSRRAVVAQANKISGSKAGPPQNFILVSTLNHHQRSLISRNCRNPEHLAVLHTVLMIIKLSGNSLEHQHLIAAMNELRLCLDDSSVMPLKDFDSFLDRIRREKYILKEKKNLMDTESVYSWGPRAYIEFPPANMAEFIFKVRKMEQSA